MNIFLQESQSISAMEVSFSDFINELSSEEPDYEILPSTVSKTNKQHIKTEKNIKKKISKSKKSMEISEVNITHTSINSDASQTKSLEEGQTLKRPNNLKSEKLVHKKRRIEDNVIDVIASPQAEEEVIKEEGPSQEDIEMILSCYLAKEVADCQVKVQECLTVVTDETDALDSHARPMYDCHVCSEYKIEDFSAFYCHLKSHHMQVKVDNNNNDSIEDEIQIGNQRRVPCKICGYILLSSNLKQHMTMHIDHIRCSFCHEFVVHADAEEHMEVHTQHFKCGICSELIKSRLLLKHHLRKHKHDLEYSCDQCPLRFIGLARMIAHRSMAHMSIDPFCAECPFCFKLTSVINSHIYNAYTCRVRCPVCNTRVRNSKEFTLHTKSHSRKRPNRRARPRK